MGKESEGVIDRAKRFIWLIDKRNGGANEIDIFNLIDIYLSMFGDNYSKVFKTPQDEFIWLYSQIQKGVIEYNNKPLPVDGSKLCVTCNRMLSYTEYHKNGRAVDGLKTKCKECSNKYQQRYWKDNPEAVERYKAASRMKSRKRRKYD